MFGLYWSSNTGAFAVEAALAIAGADYEIIPCNTKSGDHRTAVYTRVNPRQQVPALRLPDDSVITESAAMLMHLADVFPDADLLPPSGTADRAKAYRWLVFLSANVYEADLRYYYSERYAGDGGNINGVRQAALAQLDRDLGIIGAQMTNRDTVLEYGWGLCDVYLSMLCQWHPFRARLYTENPALKACASRTLTQPVVARIAEQHSEMPLG